MATRGSISIRNADGSYTGIYTHWDGYLDHNGKILRKHYTSEDKIRQLLALGDISVLGPEIGEQHPFDAPSPYDQPNAYRDYKRRYGRWCKAYMRDRGETGCEAKTHGTLAELLDQIGQEYDYVWEGDHWTVRFDDSEGKFITMARAYRLQKQAA